jgi:hypothetical protein
MVRYHAERVAVGGAPLLSTLYFLPCACCARNVVLIHFTSTGGKTSAPQDNVLHHFGRLRTDGLNLEALAGDGEKVRHPLKDEMCGILAVMELVMDI